MGLTSAAREQWNYLEATFGADRLRSTKLPLPVLPGEWGYIVARESVVASFEALLEVI